MSPTQAVPTASRKCRAPGFEDFLAMKLRVPPQFSDRFQFIFEIDDRTSPGTIVGRAEIYEYTVLRATLLVVRCGLTRMDMADVLMARCLRWAEVRLGQSDARAD